MARRSLGAALLSRDDQPHVIHWLAVRGSSRRAGVGSLLMSEIKARWPAVAITVTTFGREIADGTPAHLFYQRHGFESRGPTEPGPDGGLRELFVFSGEPFIR